MRIKQREPNGDQLITKWNVKKITLAKLKQKRLQQGHTLRTLLH